MLKNVHSYCSKCKHGKELFEAMLNQIDIPNQCEECYPHNLRDNVAYEVRNYVPIHAKER